MSDTPATPVDNATVPVASSPPVAPVDAPHLTGESSESTTDPVDTTAGAADPDGEGTEPSKTRDRAAERRISKLTKRYEEALRENGRLQGLVEARAPATSTPTPSDAKPQQSQYATVDEYQEALTDWKVDQKLSERDRAQADRARESETIQAEQQRGKTVVEKIAAAGKDIEGFEDVMETITTDKTFPLNKTMVDFLGESEQSALLAQWLVDNREEALRIARLDPAVAVRALDREEKRLAAKPPVRTTRTPPPPPTVSGRSTPQVDLSNITNMDDYAKARGFS